MARHIFPSTPWQESLESMTCGSYNMDSKFPSCYLEGRLGFKRSNSPFSHSFAAGDSIQKAMTLGNHLCLLALPW